MTRYSGLKSQIRARMALTGEQYSVARRAILVGDDDDVEHAIGELIAAIKEYLSGKGRWLVPHGFAVDRIHGRTIIFRLPAIWNVVKGAIPLRASEVASTSNLDELRALIERGLQSGEWLPNASLVEWTPTLPESPRPGDLAWTVRARISG